MIIYDPYTICFHCEASVVFLAAEHCSDPIYESVDEDSLTCQDMADIEDGKPVLFDEARHKRHVCREQKEG